MPNPSPLTQVADVKAFWQPPALGEVIVSMVRYRDFIVVATDRGIYTIAENGNSDPLERHVVTLLEVR